MTMPRRAASCGEAWRSGAPARCISPPPDDNSPAMMRDSVLFPDPFAPSKPRTRPCRNVRSTPSSATTPPKCLVIPRAIRSGGAISPSVGGAAGRPSGEESIKLWFREPFCQKVAVRLILHRGEGAIQVVGGHLKVDWILDDAVRHGLELAALRQSHRDTDGVAADIRRVRLRESAHVGAAV